MCCSLLFQGHHKVLKEVEALVSGSFKWSSKGDIRSASNPMFSASGLSANLGSAPGGTSFMSSAGSHSNSSRGLNG